jgi:acyl carrier protein
MKDKTQVIAAIYRAADEINRQLPAEKKLAKDESSAINTKSLDSLNMVNFLLGVEEELQLNCGLEIDLAASLSPTAEVPFANIGQLADYILKHANPGDAS